MYIYMYTYVHTTYVYMMCVYVPLCFAFVACRLALAYEDNLMNLPSGKMLGGSTSINYMATWQHDFQGRLNKKLATQEETTAPKQGALTRNHNSQGPSSSFQLHEGPRGLPTVSGLAEKFVLYEGLRGSRYPILKVSCPPTPLTVWLFATRKLEYLWRLEPRGN